MTDGGMHDYEVCVSLPLDTLKLINFISYLTLFSVKPP